MLNSRNKKIAILSAVAISILILGLFQNIKIAYAQNYEETMTLSQNFSIDEFSENEGVMENITSIDIDLGSSRWNVTDIELNFTNIKLERQTKSIEDSQAGWQYKTILKTHPNFYYAGLGVEMYLPEPTLIYGVYIYGYKQDTTEPVYIQIRDYDGATNKPVDSFLYSQLLNISLVPKWYFQNFSTPLPLSAGRYYLVLFNQFYGDTSAAHFWGYTNSPNNSSLHTAEYYTQAPIYWTNVQQGHPFLYKLLQKVNKSYYPEDIEMAVTVNDNSYNITNGNEIGSGNVSISTNYSPNTNIFHIPITNNISAKLNFSLDYRIYLNNSLFVDGNVLIRENSLYHPWTLSFYLERSDGNYTVKFSYPNSWTILSILRNDISLTDGVDFINNTVDKAIYIFNKTIPYENVPWEIIAESPNIPINFNGPDPEITAGSESISGVTSPLNGNYTYLLYAGAYEKYRNSTFYTGGVLSFSYIIPSTGPNGDWTAVIYWNNGTDAGVASSDFTVTGGVTIISGGGGGGGGGGGTTVTGLDPLVVYTISSIIIIGVVAGLTSYQVAKKIKKNRELELKKLHSKFIDILSLNYLLVIDKKTGLNVYEQFFAGKVIDASLISGFLEAIRNFGIELTGTYSQSQTVKLEYQESKILMSEFKDFRIVLVMAENPSDDFLNSITTLSYDVDRNFGELIQNFKGDTTQFKGISQCVEKNFNVSFIAPLTIGDVGDIKLKDAEIAMINKAKAIMKQNNLNFFFTSFLLPEQTYDPKKTRTVFDLIEKKIFVPTKIT
ncbi:MAG: hypothetical protein ACFFHV_07575 [Promethearchaeota archaeon]